MNQSTITDIYQLQVGDKFRLISRVAAENIVLEACNPDFPWQQGCTVVDICVRDAGIYFTTDSDLYPGRFLLQKEDWCLVYLCTDHEPTTDFEYNTTPIELLFGGD